MRSYTTTNSTPIIIDTDVSIGQPQRDVDDALAIIMALNSPQLSVKGITLTFGNDSLKNVETSMSSLASLTGFPNIHITPGAESLLDLDKPTEATRFLESQLEQGPRTLLCLGPLTNAATLIKVRPDLQSKITEIIMVAGRRPGQQFLTGNCPRSHPDLNFEMDPKAVFQLLGSGIKLVFAPFEVSSKVHVNKLVLDRIAANKTSIAQYLVANSKPWLWFWQQSFSTPLAPIEYFNPFDCLAIAWLTDPDLLRWSTASLFLSKQLDKTNPYEKESELNSNKPYLLADFSMTANGQTYIYDVERETFLERLILRLR